MSRDVFICPEGVQGRVDKVLSELFPEVSRSLIRKAIEGGRVTRFEGGVLEPKSKIYHGDKLFIDVSRPKVEPLKPYDYPLNVLFEDESILVVNKPTSMVTHPGDGTGEDTLIHALIHHTADICPVGAPNRPGIVHRLDKDTSGAIVIAKTEQAYHALVSQFSERKVNKQYMALLCGHIHESEGEFRGSIARHPKVRVKMTVSEAGKSAITRWQTLCNYGQDFTLVTCKILTGRTHQIRVHFSDAHYPIVGDATYGSKRMEKKELFPRLMLHAIELGLKHPVTQQAMVWKAPLPDDFQGVINQLGLKYDVDSIPLKSFK
ncbi:MAG: RluA family pseudouridine synthase [Opitutales bacterium]|nr:RluA family pseudouridine synthase [Opitutales bacterium]